MTRISNGKPLGLIGLGLLGSALAERWLAAGWNVIGYDRDPSRRREHVARGGEVAESAADVGIACARIVLCLPDRGVSREVGGELPAGRTIIDSTTGDSQSARELAEQLRQGGSQYIEAAISGSSEQVRQGDVLVITGGDPGAVADCADLWTGIAHRIVNAGPAGHAATMKLVTNLVLGLNRAALAEGLAFANSQGLKLASTLAVLQESQAYSRIMDTKGPKMVSGEFSPQARLSQHARDVCLMLATASAKGLELPLSATHDRLLRTAIERGLGDLDNSALIRVYGDSE